jgi:hypothetical protein
MRRLALATPLLLTGCAALLPSPPLIEKRFGSYSAANVTVPAIGIAIATADTDAQSGAISIKELSDRGQAALIEHSKDKVPIQLKGGPKDQGATVFQNTIKRRMIVSILPDRFLDAGDRVDAIRVSLSINPRQPGGWKIAGWTQASNGQTTIDVGKLTGVSSSKVSAETGLKIADVLPDFKISGENSRTRTEEVEIKDTTDLDAAVGADGVASLFETAGWRQSLAHNLTMDVIAVAPTLSSNGVRVVNASSLVQEEGASKGEPALADKVRLSEVVIYMPLAGQTQAICGKATLTYRIRHVYNTKARATFSESDDAVQFIEGERSAPFLFSPPPLNALYTIWAGNRELEYVFGKKTEKEIGKSQPAGLRFASVDDATAFNEWLKERRPASGQLGNAVIGVEDHGKFRKLTDGEMDNLLVGPENGALIREAQAFDPAACPS